MKPSFLIAGVGIALAVIFALQYWLNRSTQTQVPVQPELAEKVAEVQQSAEAEIPDDDTLGQQDLDLVPPLPPLPSLDDSDTLVRELVGSDAWPEAWLAPEQLVRRAATVLDNAANGSYPKGQLEFLAPKGGFRVQKRGNSYRVDPQSYARFDPLVDALERLEPEVLASVYRRLQPLLVAALGELGQRQPPEKLLVAAVNQLQAVPQLTGDVALVRPSVLYKYRDKSLEGLSALQKQLLRMGPDNVVRVQGYLTELMQFLDLSDPGATESADQRSAASSP